jgi:hypothetical protein
MLDKVILIRVSNTEHADIQAAAIMEGRSVSNLVRSVVKSHIKGEKQKNDENHN